MAKVISSKEYSKLLWDIRMQLEGDDEQIGRNAQHVMTWLEENKFIKVQKKNKK